MGLDNAIHFRFWKKGTDSVRTIEICYWRKYWNIRNDILKDLEDRFTKSIYCQYLIPHDNSILLKDIECILKDYSNISYCEKHDNCIWSPVEQAFHNRVEAAKLRFLIEFIDGKISLCEFFCAAQCWDKDYFKEEFFDLIESGEIEYEIEFIDSY